MPVGLNKHQILYWIIWKNQYTLQRLFWDLTAKADVGTYRSVCYELV